MNKMEARQLVSATRDWFMEDAKEDSVYGLILDSFEVDDFSGDAFVVPVPFARFTEHPDWSQEKDDKSVDSQIRRMQDKMDHKQCPLRTSVYLMPKKGYCYLILGTEQVEVVRTRKKEGGLESVTLSFDDSAAEKETLPRFSKGDLVQLSASSPIKGWLYLFAVDASRVITPVYPGEGEKSAVRISENSKLNLSDKINECIKAASALVEASPLRYCGDAEGSERVVALVIETENPLPITIAHLRSRFPLPFLFAHAHKHKGMGYSQTDSRTDFSSLPLGQIAIGTLDYYYEG